MIRLPASRGTRALIAIVAALAAVNVAQYAVSSSKPQPRSVLYYPEQEIRSAVPGVEGPAVLSTDDVVVLGKKCNQSPSPVPVTGVTSWVSIDPAGTVVETSRGQAVRQPGCVEKEYRDQLPAAVTARILAVGQTCTTWQITGRETPTDPLLLPVVWQTEPFKVCPLGATD